MSGTIRMNKGLGPAMNEYSTRKRKKVQRNFRKMRKNLREPAMWADPWKYKRKP